jgi:transcriptional regulator with XRE-family HTH domain
MSLASIRRQRGLTIEHIAVLAGVNKSTISRAERGLQTLRPETVVKLSKALKVSPRRLLEDR